MNFKKTLLAAALVGSSVVSVSAFAVPTVMKVTSGQFGMGFFTGGTFLPITFFGSGAADITDTYNAPGWNTSAAVTSGHPTSIGSFDFSGSWVNTYTAAAATQAGVPGGGPAPVFTGPLVNGAFTINMSSFFANWNGTDFNQGNAAVAGTLSGCSASGCTYTMAWQSLIQGGPPFGGQTGSWVLNGTIAPIPEASTYGMMAAGLAMVGFVARRRTRSAV
ncbi:MAG: PEP-CTERM sorting domain-containing protein [Thiobacillus sp.]|nr:PEP-CTERM sorting domain-containing protein [Thiobacillus sp.]